jgi:hypothetical protein
MRCTCVRLLPLLLALTQLAVSSSYSTQSAQQQQEQQQKQCWQPVRNSYAAGLQSEQDNGSCPAQLVPLAEAPAPATVATGSVAANDTQHSRRQLVDSSSSSGSQGAEQACVGTGDCSWQTFIVRFSEYKMLSEHKQALHKVRTAALATPRMQAAPHLWYTQQAAGVVWHWCTSSACSSFKNNL